MILVEIHHASIVVCDGGGAVPPVPPRFFEPCKLDSKHMRSFLKPTMRALCLQMGGLPPQLHRFFKPCKLASEHVSVFQSYSNGGGGGGGGLHPPPPPTPPLF